MNIGESVLFAAIMTLMEELESNKKEILNVQTESFDYTEDISTDILYDSLNAKNKLCKMAQDLFDKADEVCQTTTDASANELIPAIINGIIFEMVDALNASDDGKKRIYEFALQYCAVDSDFPWEILYIADGQIAGALLDLANAGIDMIIVACNKSGIEDISVSFIKLFTEFMCYLEDAVTKEFGLTILSKRPQMIVLDKAISALKKEMKRMEDEDPTLKEQTVQSEKQINLENLFNNARTALNNENMSSAAAYYQEILKVDPNDWEAMFYSVFCSVYRTTYTTNDILKSTLKIVQCSPMAMKQAKNKLVSKMDTILALGEVTSWVCRLASNCFVASMDAFKASSGGAIANTNKISQVNAIISMLFLVGDSIEENFGDDFEIVKNTACECWKTGFLCYENCNMPAPVKLYEQYLKLLKYEPSFRCSKPLTEKNSAGNSEGCYIATAVYGSYDCPQVWTLRRYRDYFLAQSWLGRVFIRFYYSTSPTLVKLFGHTNYFNVGFRKILDKFVNNLIAEGYEDTPYTDGMNRKKEEKNNG